ncbi:hypothetical protein GCM10027586_20980 [Kineococcus gypseus]
MAQAAAHRREAARAWSQEAATAAHYRLLQRVCATRLDRSDRLAVLVSSP